jgi:large subunit ribosomal protein L30
MPKTTKQTSKNGDKRLRITLVKSPTGYTERQKATVRALGLRHLRDSVEQTDTPVVRGMINKVSHLVVVEEVQ